MSLVSLSRIKENDIESFKESIINSLDSIDYNLPNNSKFIVIKPNMCYYWDYTTGHTTDPRFILALVKILREQINDNVNIKIIESDASAMKTKHVFKMLGYEKIFQKEDVDLVNLSDDTSEKKEIIINQKKVTFSLSDTIKRADFKINVPKIKYMTDPVKMTCALKNIFGCISEPNKFKYHSYLSETIVGINKEAPFDLHIIDGNYIVGTITKKIGLVMSSIDPVSLDVVASKMLGINPLNVNYIKLANQYKIGKITYDLRGESYDYYYKMLPRTNYKQKITAMAYKIIINSPLGKRINKF